MFNSLKFPNYIGSNYKHIYILRLVQIFIVNKNHSCVADAKQMIQVSIICIKEELWIQKPLYSFKIIFKVQSFSSEMAQLSDKNKRLYTEFLTNNENVELL